MECFSEKIHLTLTPPSEDDAVSDHLRITDALTAMGYERVHMPLKVMRMLYPMCRQSGFDITVTLVCSADGWTVTAVESGDTTAKHYGLCVDYGSTTVVMQLVDLNSGEVLDQVRVMNAQIEFGTDILTRIIHTLESDEHIADMQRVTANTFNSLFDELCSRNGIDVKSLPVLIISGNTTMIHFLLGLNAWTVFASPYAPVTSDAGWFWGRDLGMDFEGMVYIIPSASNYIGGDIVSGLLSIDLAQRDEVAMFFDIGTNGELVIGNRQWLMAGAGAAGPALEGYISRFGMRAQDGTIDKVKIENGVLSYTTIGSKKPIGICGSGIIDLLAQMRLAGWVNIAGELVPEASESIVWHGEEEQYVVVYASAEESALGEPLYFSQLDIRQYLDTKAAAFTMIDCLMATAGCTEADIDKCYLSGAFCAHSDLESAITIGIFPDLPREKFVAIPNSSLDGARTLLLDRNRLKDAEYISRSAYCVQFASIPDFIIRMQAAKFIPHTDMERFPIVAQKLNDR